MTAVHDINAVDLKERIAISDAFTPKERDFLLDAINDRISTKGIGVIVEHAPRNYLGRIDHIWIALSVDEGGEGVVAAPIGPGGMTVPLVAADKQRLDAIKPLSRALAVRFRKVIRIAKFTQREDMEVYRP